MKEKSHASFIIIDDDPINNMICSQIIREALPGAEVQVFTDPEAGIVFIHSTYSIPAAGDTILLLDINMPIATGWDVLNKFREFDDSVRKHMKIYMLSSSVDIHDKQKAGEYPFVLGYIEKPLTIKQVQSMTADLIKLI